MSDERATKTCPDCAEEVLAAARKCRFCGYRFDGRPARRSGESGGSLLDLLRTTSHDPVDLPELLEGWELVLWPGEDEAATLSFVSIDGESGFALATDRRLHFLAATRGGRPPELRMQRLLDDLVFVRLQRRLISHVLTVGWRDGDMAIHGERPQLARLHDHLTALDLPDRIDDPS